MLKNTNDEPIGLTIENRAGNEKRKDPATVCRGGLRDKVRFASSGQNFPGLGGSLAGKLSFKASSRRASSALVLRFSAPSFFPWLRATRGSFGGLDGWDTEFP